MGIDYDGGMIVGACGDMFSEPEGYEDDFSEWVEDNDMDVMSLHYDASEEYQIIGFKVPDVPVSEMDGDWLKDVKEKAKLFKELTGVEPKLIGTQNIW